MSEAYGIKLACGGAERLGGLQKTDSYGIKSDTYCEKTFTYGFIRFFWSVRPF